MRGVVVNLPLDVKLTLTYLLLARGFRFIEAGARPGDDRKNHFHARLTAVDTPFAPQSLQQSILSEGADTCSAFQDPVHATVEASVQPPGQRLPISLPTSS